MNNNGTYIDVELSDSIDIPAMMSIIKKLSGYNQHIYYHGSNIDYSFVLHDSCTLQEVDKLESTYKHKLPDDYKQFLLTSNGLNLSQFVSSRIFSVDEIYDVKNVFSSYPENIIIIGACCDATVHIGIDLCSDKENNIFVHDIMDSDSLNSIHCGFAQFLNRFIITYGSSFWEWGMVENH